ncbi:GNAT family N-acetyltransferase [Burkholderia gladioli]|uniref:GNAT family N-acetyltransferase n=1 Tax=Burkholderia gladioli TaxID=28095 RepID=UPI001641511A|nr:GNAT family N-acetyltransferase [Burkholderia gladioli]
MSGSNPVTPAAAPESTVPASPADTVILRPYEPADAAAVATIHQQPVSLRYTLAMPCRPAEVVSNWHAPLVSGAGQGFALCAVIDGKVVGHLALFVHPPPRSHGASFGIAVHDAYAGRGIGARLMQAMLDTADHELGLRRIELNVFADNTRAIALYERFGFVTEAFSRAHAIRDGELADGLLMARLVAAPPLAPPGD